MRLIDADALENASIPFETHGGGRFIALGSVRSAPTIDPASLCPKGEWEMRGGKRYCTHCGERACVTRDTDDFWYTKGTDFCPNCGADMRGNPHDS